MWGVSALLLAVWVLALGRSEGSGATTRGGWGALSDKVKRAARREQFYRRVAVNRPGRPARQADAEMSVGTLGEATAVSTVVQTHDPLYDATAGGAELGQWYHHLDSNGDFRLSSTELVDVARAAAVPLVAAQVLAEYEQNARVFEQGLCKKIPSDLSSVFADHHNPRDDWSDAKDLDMRRDRLVKGVGCTTDQTVLEKALQLIRARKLLIKPKWSIRTSKVENGVTVTLSMPVIRHLAQLYNALHLYELRELIILLLDRGVDINTATANVQNSVPVAFALMTSFHLDYILQRAIFRSRPRVDPVYTHRAHRQGLTLPHCFAERTTSVITKHILQTGDHMTFANITFEDAVKALAANPDGLGSEWRGDLFKTEFASLFNVSALYRSVVNDFNANGPQRHLPLAVASGIADELFVQLLKDAFEFTNWKFDEVDIRLPLMHFNVLHIMVLNNYPKALAFFLGAYRRKLFFASAAYRQRLGVAMATALIQQDTTGRNPVHQAALLYGQGHPITEALIAMELKVAGDDIRLRSMKDGLGNCVHDYLNNTATFESPAKVLKDDKTMRTLTELSEARDRSLEALKAAQSSAFVPDKQLADDGGWAEYGHRTDLEATPPERCDVRQYQGMPTPAELKMFLETNEPIVMRGAGKFLDMPKYLWARDNFRNRFHNATALVSKVPYTHQTDSPFRPATSLRTTVAAFLSSFPVGTNVSQPAQHQQQQQQQQDAPLEMHSGESPPMYLFASDFYLHNPLLLENMTAPFDIMRRISGTSLAQGGVGSDWEGLERNAQMYVGAPGSGAPMHLHQIAVNYLAYGRKRWAMLPPSKAFYSMEPALSYFSSAGYQRDKADLLECTQHADDLFLVPDSWGHVTLNVEASIGVAYEFEYRAWIVRIPDQLPKQVFRRRQDLAYAGWTVDTTDAWNHHWLRTMRNNGATITANGVITPAPPDAANQVGAG